MLLFTTLLSGLALPKTENCVEAIRRKAEALASDVVYNVSRGNIRPWKNLVLGLGLSAITSSKLVVQILNRQGHCINYSDVKALETEFAYSVVSEDQEAPDGIRLGPNLSTACVWDNNDANIETLDGKTTWHATVGHTYQNCNEECGEENSEIRFRSGRNRRKFVGVDRNVPEFRQSLSSATITLPLAHPVSPSATQPLNANVTTHFDITPLQFFWFVKGIHEHLPLYAGFISQFIVDYLPVQRLCYNDPISRSPTSSDVVRETMVRTLKIAQEANQEFAVVTYDLAIAQKAYAIQALEAPRFKNLLILLGNFHLELAFFWSRRNVFERLWY